MVLLNGVALNELCAVVEVIMQIVYAYCSQLHAKLLSVCMAVAYW